MSGEDQDSPFAEGFARLARPLAEVMVRNGMTIAHATEALKRALLDAAQGTAGPAATDSQLSLLTGVHRKDVRRLRAETPQAPRRSAISPAATVLAVWAHTPAFQADDGAPLPLLAKGRDGAPGFDDVVRAARVDLPPATVLSHVLAAQAVAEVATPGGPRLFLKRQTLGMDGDAADRLEAYVRNLEVHLAAAGRNLLAGAEHFERALHVNQLSAASLATLDAEAEAAATAMLEQLNRRALELQARDAQEPGAADGRFSAGAYVFPRDFPKTPGGDAQ